MAEGSSIITALVTTGFGAALGSIGATVISSFSKRGMSRAIAADRVTNAAGNLADRLDRMNDTLEKENVQMRRAVIALTDVMDEIIPLLPDEVIRRKAHNAINTARLALR